MDLQQMLEYILRKRRQAGTPTWTDTPGLGNVEPWQIGPMEFPKMKESDLYLQQMLQKKPGTWNQRMQLEQSLLDRENNNIQAFNNARQPQHSVPAQGQWDRIDPFSLPMGHYGNAANWEDSISKGIEPFRQDLGTFLQHWSKRM